MDRITQWQMTLRWAFRITVGFFLIYTVLIAVRAPFVYAKVSDILPDDMKRNFLGMVIVVPFVFSGLVFMISLVLLRLFFSLSGTMRRNSPNNGVEPIR